MSAVGVTDALVEAIDSGRYDFIVANFANPDMVGHTGVWDATIDALAIIDALPGPHRGRRRSPSTPATRRRRARVLAITADHGNADELRDAAGNPVTAHSLNPVPFVLDRARGPRHPARGRRPGGRRADPAGVRRPARAWPGMTGRSRPRPCDSIRRRDVQRSKHS